MPTAEQVRAETWWDREIVPASLDNLVDRLCAHYGVPRTYGGTKGNEAHLKGRHRSIEWALNSAYCRDRSYGTVDLRDRRGNWRHIRAFDLKLPAAPLQALCRRLDTAVRAGRLPQIAEWFGTFDGRTVVGWFEGRPASSDDSHLGHLHGGLWTVNADDDHSDLFAILTGDDMTLTTGQEGALGVAYQAGLALITGAEKTLPAAADPGGKTVWATAAIRQLVGKVDGLTSAVAALAEAVNAGGGSIDTAAVLARIDERAAEDVTRDAEQAALIAALQAKVDAYRQAEADAARVAADTLDN